MGISFIFQRSRKGFPVYPQTSCGGTVIGDVTVSKDGDERIYTSIEYPYTSMIDTSVRDAAKK